MPPRRLRRSSSPPEPPEPVPASEPPGVWGDPPPTSSQPPSPLAASADTNGWGLSVPAPPSPGHAGRAGLPPPPPAVLVVKARIVDALLTGIAAAAIGGVAWWAVVTFTGREFPYLALVVGLLAGQGVLVGARKGGPLQGFLAATFCLMALLVTQYFVVRSLAIGQAADSGVSASIPLWQGFDTARRVVTDSIGDHLLTGVFFAIAVVAAAVSAGSPSRRPAVA